MRERGGLRRQSQVWKMYEGVLQMNIPHPHAEKALVRREDNRIQTEESGIQDKEK